MHQKTHTTASTMHCTMSKAREMVRLLMPEFGEKLQTAAMISPKTGTSWMRNIITHSETESAMVFSGRYSTARPGLEKPARRYHTKPGLRPGYKPLRRESRYRNEFFPGPSAVYFCIGFIEHHKRSPLLIKRTVQVKSVFISRTYFRVSSCIQNNMKRAFYQVLSKKCKVYCAAYALNA